MRPIRYRRTLDPELVQVLDEIARHPDRERFAFDPLLLVELGLDALLWEERQGRLALLEQELASVHRGELARLCRAAAALRLRGAGGQAEHAPGSALDAESLRACLREELALAELFGAELCPAVLLEVSRRCLAADPARWPSATALAAVSLMLAPHELGRLRLGQALFAAGAARDAERVFAAALARGPSPRGRRLLRLGLGRVLRSEEEGRER